LRNLAGDLRLSYSWCAQLLWFIHQYGRKGSCRHWGAKRNFARVRKLSKKHWGTNRLRIECRSLAFTVAVRYNYTLSFQWFAFSKYCTKLDAVCFLIRLFDVSIISCFSSASCCYIYSGKQLCPQVDPQVPPDSFPSVGGNSKMQFDAESDVFDATFVFMGS
jgi:hypothetical protein